MTEYASILFFIDIASYYTGIGVLFEQPERPRDFDAGQHSDMPRSGTGVARRWSSCCYALRC